MCGARGVDIREDPFPVSRESDKKVHKVLIVTDGSKKLTLVLAETCEVKNVNSQKYPSNRSQDTQSKLHSSSSDLALIIDQSK